VSADWHEEPMEDYAVIVPAYNEERLLAETIAALREAMGSVPNPGVLVVVDNNSSDATAAIAREAGADRVVFEPHNQIARARNAGAAATEAPHLVFVDADTRVAGETLRLALEQLASGGVVGGGALIVTDEPVGGIVGWLVRTWNRVAFLFRYAAGSFFFCRRDGFEAVGGFDETVYAGEEVWLAKRLKRWGRPRGLGFGFIVDPPVVTSARKAQWYGTGDFVRQLLVFAICPWATRSRRFCRMWYERPTEEGETEKPSEPSEGA